MSDKEMLKEADEWLYSMKCLLSVKTDEEDRAYTQKRIDLFNWLIEQAERVQELEELKNAFDDLDSDYIDLMEQNKRYREVVEYVITAKPTHYKNLENALVDITHVIMEMLEEESE